MVHGMAHARPATLVALAILSTSALFGQLSNSNQTTAAGASVIAPNPAAPIANAGPNQTANVGDQVTLDGSASTNPSGQGTLTYNWVFTSIPAGSMTVLRRGNSVMPTFFVDVPGTYIVMLTVSNGAGSSTSSVTVSTFRTPPVANAGPNQTVPLGSTVALNGSGSTSVDGRPLTYAWILTARPPGSTAALLGANTVTPSFVADQPGTYMAQLIVNDGLPSAPSTVTITTQIVKPVANAGPAQMATVGVPVQLNGAGSTDANGLPLTYQWSLIALPVGSKATLSNPQIVNPTFTPDLPGTYIAQLIVNNGTLNSDPSTVMITTVLPPGPAANAGPNQTVNVGSTVQLNGSGTDPQNLPLTFQWSLISKPAGSTALLSSPSIPNPTFVADVAGTYIAQLIVNNGSLNSPPSTVTISTTCSQPTANPGPNQFVGINSVVTLNGSGSGDVCHDPLTYAWSFTTRPAGSTATLSGANTVAPVFVADVAGTYVVQLIVNNGFSNSNPATTTITASNGGIVFFGSPLNLNTLPGTLVIILPAPAGPGGQIVNLTSSNPNVATVPPSVTIGPGAVATNVTVTPGSSSGSTTLTASAPGFVSGTATVNVTLPTITLTLDSGIVGLTSTLNGLITLSSPAPAGAVITLSATPGGIVKLQPLSVSISPGAMTGGFTVTGLAAGSATIVASSPGFSSGSADISVGALGQIILPANVTVGPNQSVPFPITLATAAPLGGVLVSLTSSDPSKATITPTVFIPFQATTPTVQPQLNGLNFGTITISASAPGFIGDSKLVQVGAGMSFVPAGIAIPANATQNLLLTLSSPAPAGGLTVNLSSSDPSKATVPASVTVVGNTSSVNVPITGVAAGAATITASAANLGTATASVSVFAFGQIILPANVSVAQGQTLQFPVTLPSPAPPGGTAITLTSSDPSKVVVTPSVFVPQGATTPTTQPQVTGVNIGAANITASGPGFTSATQVVKVPASLSFAPQTLTIGAATTQSITLNLSVPAPPGGLLVNLSSDNPGVASVPSTILFPPSATTLLLPVTGGAPGSATIHASALPAIPDTTASVTVVSQGLISLPGNVSLSPGQTASFAVSLSAPAPAGGVTVTLASSDPSKVTVSPASVFIAQGATTPATQPQVSGLNSGSATISASAPGFSPASQLVQVSSRSVSFFPASLTISGSTTQNLQLNLSSPAPAGGLTINLSSSNAGVAAVPATVTFPANTSNVNVPVTGVGPGTATITASAPNIVSGTASITVMVDILLPARVTLATGQSAQYSVTLVNPAPSGGVFITLTSSDPSKVSVTSSIFIPQGATVPSRSPVVTGLNLGSATIVASAPGLASGSGQVQVTGGAASLAVEAQRSGDLHTKAATNRLLAAGGSDILLPATTTVAPGATVTYPVFLANPAPSGGVFLTLISSNSSKVTVNPASIFIPQGETGSTRATVTGVDFGSATITVAGGGLAPGSGQVQVTSGGIPSLSLSFSPASLTINGFTTQNLTLNLSSPASASGLTVNLNSSNPGIATVPAFINFGPNASSVTVPVTGVAAGPATLTASATGISNATAGVIVAAAGGGGSSFFSPASLTVNAGGTQNLTLNLSGPAPAGLTASLTSSNTGVATVPATVAFAAGAISASVPVTGVAGGSSTVTSSVPGFGNANAAIAVASQQSGIILPPTVTLPPGQSASYPLTLANPAPSGGVFVTLTSSDPSKVTVTSGLFIAQGMTSSSRASVTGIDFGSAIITASAAGLGSVTGQVQVTSGGTPGAALSFSPGSLTVPAGVTQNLTLNLSSPAPGGGLTISLSSSNTGVATVPAAVSVGANATSVAVPVTGLAGGTATISASAPGIPGATASVTVSSSASQSGIILPPTLTVLLGQSASFPVTLATPAPLGGVFVMLASSDPSKVTVLPQGVFIPQGGTTSGRVSVSGIEVGSAIITATAIGYTPASVQVQATSSLTLNLLPATLTIGTTTQNLTLTLPSQPGPGGQIVNVSSSNPAVASVPATVTIAQNVNSVAVPVTGVAAGSATITVSAPGFNPASSSITVASASAILLPASLLVPLGGSVILPVNLGTGAPAGGVLINLTSSDPAKATITPSSIFIPQGATTGSVTVMVNGVTGGVVTITASGAGLGSASLQASVVASLSFQPTNLLIQGTSATKFISLMLSAPAPAGGLTFNLRSSNSAVASVPSTVTLPANATTVSVPVTSVSPGSAVIQASSLPFYPPIAIPVTVVSGPSVILPSFESLGIGLSVVLPVSLSAPAPPGGTFITLTSSDITKVIVTSSVFVPAGATTPTTLPVLVAAGDTVFNEGFANIIASANGYALASLGLYVNDGGTIAIGGNLTLGVGESDLVPVGLPGPAPAQGVTITMISSNPAIASVTPSVFVPGGANLPTMMPVVTGISPGLVTITATGPYIGNIRLLQVVQK